MATPRPQPSAEQAYARDAKRVWNGAGRGRGGLSPVQPRPKLYGRPGRPFDLPENLSSELWAYNPRDLAVFGTNPITVVGGTSCLADDDDNSYVDVTSDADNSLFGWMIADLVGTVTVGAVSGLTLTARVESVGCQWQGDMGQDLEGASSPYYSPVRVSAGVPFETTTGPVNILQPLEVGSPWDVPDPADLSAGLAQISVNILSAMPYPHGGTLRVYQLGVLVD